MDSYEAKVKDAETRVNSVSTDCKGNPIKVVEYRKYKEVLVAWESGEEVWTTWRHFSDKSIKKPEVRLGTEHKCSTGDPIVVVEYPNSKKVRVRWKDGAEKVLPWRDIIKGFAKKPLESRVGMRFNNSSGDSYEVVAWRSSQCVDVRWGSTGKLSTHQWSHVSRGNVRNPNKLVCGVGVVGKRFPDDSHIYNSWNRMIVRTHQESFLQANPTYRKVEVSEELLVYENFYKVFTNLVGCEDESFSLDKDILSQHLGLKKPTYSEYTIALVPRRINSIVIDRDVMAGIRVSEFGTFYVDYRDEYMGAYGSLEEAQNKYLMTKTEDLMGLVDEYEGRLDPRVVVALKEWVF